MSCESMSTTGMVIRRFWPTVNLWVFSATTLGKRATTVANGCRCFLRIEYHPCPFPGNSPDQIEPSARCCLCFCRSLPCFSSGASGRKTFCHLHGSTRYISLPVRFAGCSWVVGCLWLLTISGKLRLPWGWITRGISNTSVLSLRTGVFPLPRRGGRCSSRRCFIFLPPLFTGHFC